MCKQLIQELTATWVPSLATDPAADAAFQQEMGINSLVIAPTNEPGPLFHFDTTSPLVATLLIDPCSLPGPYTNISMSDALEELTRDLYDTLWVVHRGGGFKYMDICSHCP